MEWKPIDTAPDDQDMEVWLRGPQGDFLGKCARWFCNSPCCCAYEGFVASDDDENFLEFGDDNYPTHWKPVALPDPPEVKE